MNWKTYIKDCNRVGLESPIPYKVVPYKNGIGIKKTVFLKPIKPIKYSKRGRPSLEALYNN